MAIAVPRFTTSPHAFPILDDLTGAIREMLCSIGRYGLGRKFGRSAFGAATGKVGLNSIVVAVRAAEEDDCKSLIPKGLRSMGLAVGSGCRRGWLWPCPEVAGVA
jgi:hypothetical protein